MKRHINIPIFIPHLGCPNQCVFCNQKTISGVTSFNPDSVVEIIEEALATVSDGCEAEIAFFGGSFTGIDPNLMKHLLGIAHSYLERGLISGIRCSTRPDYIDENVLSVLKEYGVGVVELGLQSVDEGVLSASKRGHGFSSEKSACELIVKNGFQLVGQMMIGLPGSCEESELATAEFIISAGAAAARIYPTVVFRDTELCAMASAGKYKPLDIDEAVIRSAKVMKKFIEAGVEVIRVGLCASDNLSDASTYYAGPNHPALGELVENEIYYMLIRENLELMNIKKGSSVHIFVPLGSLSKVIGQKKRNKIRLINEFSLSDVKFSEARELSEYSCQIEYKRGNTDYVLKNS